MKDDIDELELDRLRILKSLEKSDQTRDSLSRLSVEIPVVTHRLLRIKATREGKSIKEYILYLLEKEGIK